MDACPICRHLTGQPLFVPPSETLWAIRLICYLVHMVNLPRRVLSGLPNVWHLMTRYGLKNQHRPICLKKWPKWPRVARCRLPLANGSAPNMNLPGCCAVGQPPFCNQIWAGPAGFWKPRKSPPLPKPTMRKSLHTSIVGRLWRPPISNWPPLPQIS